MKKIAVIIPAFNEERSIAKVVAEIPAYVDEVIVVDNASTDNTSSVAAEAGATVLQERSPGYGNACLKGIAYCAAKDDVDRPDIIVFLDGDYSDYPAQMERHLEKIEEGYGMVIGSRALGKRLKGSITPQQVFGNWLATTLIRWIYRVEFTDLGPFRAIRFDDLLRLDMQDKTYGWTVEMQVKAAKLGLKSCEVPVDYRPRIGISKVSGTVKGTIMAGYKILWTIFNLI